MLILLRGRSPTRTRASGLDAVPPTHLVAEPRSQPRRGGAQPPHAHGADVHGTSHVHPVAAASSPRSVTRVAGFRSARSPWARSMASRAARRSSLLVLATFLVGVGAR